MDDAGRLAPEPQVGDRIGAYRLVRLLGQGTTGRVFEVEHERIGRRAAMKTLSSEHATRAGAIKRLFTEALAVNRINNGHIVEVTDIVEEGVHQLARAQDVAPTRVNGLVMELLEGQSLAQAMIGEGPMPPERFLLILAQVCEALAAAHAAGFVHRDLKPENIFLIERAGQIDFVKLLDFGLAKTVNVEASLLRNPALITLDGTFVGTPAYVSPEQAGGKTVDHRTDIYSLGVILYELVCGRLPFTGESIGDLLVKQLTSPAPPLPPEVLSTRLGRTLNAIIQRCLEKDPDARFPSAAQLAEIFGNLARGEPIEFTAIQSYLGGGAGGGRRRTGVRIAAAVVVAAALGGVAITWARRHRDADRGTVVSATPQPTSLGGGAQEVVEAKWVTLTFETDPPGAEARFVGTDAPRPLGRPAGTPTTGTSVAGTPTTGTLLGVTPFAAQFQQTAAPFEIELTLPGYERARLTTSAAVSRSVSVKLTKAASALPRRTRPSIEKETTIDPFR